MNVAQSELALHGGTPTHTASWPHWPQADDYTRQLLNEVLDSGRWALSGVGNGREPYERVFAQQFAQYCQTDYCVPASSGTTSLTIAFEALGLTRGAEVLVPGLTWVACASAVAAAGLVPVLVDVDPVSLCMSPAAVESAVGGRTEAILAVHYACNVVDLDRITSTARNRGLGLIEDCAQAHGAEHRGRRVGSVGDIGVFSMQDTKVLTSGEGGACVTSQERLARRMEQFRADGRIYARPLSGGSGLAECGEVQGRNYCLSELQAAVLIGRLRVLEEQNDCRSRRAGELDRLLSQIPGVGIVQPSPGTSRRAFYRYCFSLEPAFWRYDDIAEVLAELSAELGVDAGPLHDPLNASRLYNPLLSLEKFDADSQARLDPTQFDLPGAHRARLTYVTLPHRVLLAETEDIEDIAAAVLKVQRCRGRS